MSTKSTKYNEVPELRFPDFSTPWKIKKIAEVGNVVTGNTPSTSDRSLYGDQFNFVSPGDMNTGRYVVKTRQKLSQKGFSISRVIPAESTLFVCIGSTIGKIAQVKAASTTNQQINSVIPSDEFDADFVYLSLERIAKKIALTAGEQAVPIISKGEFQKNSIYVTGKEEQQKIARFLTDVDEKVAILQHKIDLLIKYKKTAFGQLISQRVSFASNNDVRSHAWQQKTLGELFIEITDKVGIKDIDTYSITAGKGFVTQESKFGRNISGNQNSKYTVLSIGDFSYNKGNSKTYTYGCVYMNNEGKEIAVPNVFISFRLRDKSMSPQYFQEMFENHILDKGLRQIISSGARMDGLLNVSKTEFFKIKIPVANVAEQKRIADFMTDLNKKIALEQGKLHQASRFKRALLQRLFV